MKAQVNGAVNLPPNGMEFTLTVLVERGTPEFDALFDGLTREAEYVDIALTVGPIPPSVRKPAARAHRAHSSSSNNAGDTND